MAVNKPCRIARAKDESVQMVLSHRLDGTFILLHGMPATRRARYEIGPRCIMHRLARIACRRERAWRFLSGEKIDAAPVPARRRVTCYRGRPQRPFATVRRDRSRDRPP